MPIEEYCDLREELAALQEALQGFIATSKQSQRLLVPGRVVLLRRPAQDASEVRLVVCPWCTSSSGLPFLRVLVKQAVGQDCLAVILRGPV